MPVPHLPDLQTRGGSSDDAAEARIAFEQAVERFQVVKVGGGQCAAFVGANEASEPFPQVARLGGDIIQFARCRPGSQIFQSPERHEAGLFQPGQEAVAVLDPVDRRIDGRSDRVQEIETERIGEEQGGRVVLVHLGSHGDVVFVTEHITVLAAIDKLLGH